MLFHQIRPKPDYARVKIGRRLRALGAVPLKNSVYVVPATEESLRGAQEIVGEIHRLGGRGAVCEARFVAGLTDASIEERFREIRDRDYAMIAARARQLAAAVPRGPARASDVRRRRFAGELERLERRFRALAARDPFAAGGRDRAARLLSLVEDRLQGVEPSAATGLELPRPPRAALWITRMGVMVDRIASAWLIRRFIDPRARFRFLSSRTQRRAPGGIRFDMAGGEFTHEGGRCTFEVLRDRFHLDDPALRPIAEIVHDLDLEDDRHRRPEAPGVGRMIVGLAIAHPSDEARIQEGAAIFDHLYESFRRRGE